MIETEAKQLIREWIAKKNGKVTAEEIADDTPLIAGRILSSLHAIELVLYVERLRQRSLSVEELEAGVFSDINTIYEHFFVKSLAKAG